MSVIEGFEAKRQFIEAFLAVDDTHDCQVVISEDETEDIEVINQVLRSASGQNYNTVLCVGAETPVFITPRSGIATKSRIILVVDGVPDTWNSKTNVVTFKGVLKATEQSVAVNKIEAEEQTSE